MHPLVEDATLTQPCGTSGDTRGMCPPQNALPARPLCVRTAGVWAALLLLAGCTSTPPRVASPEALPSTTTSEPATSAGEFTLTADPLDTWNAVGQIVVRTDDAEYESRAQMLGLYAVRYRREPFLLLVRALPLTDERRTALTEITAATHSGAPIHSDASARLLAVLQRELPAEILRVRGIQAAERAASTPVRKTKPKRWRTR